MKLSNEESFVLLSKNNAKILLVRNAMDQVMLKKETRLLEKERNSEEKSFLQTREHLLQQQSARICEISPRPLTSCSLQPMEYAVTKWRSGTQLAEELSPKLRRKELDGNHKMQMSLSSSLPLLSDRIAKQSSPRFRRKSPSSLVSSSLPDIHVTSNRTTEGKGPKRTSQLANKKSEVLDIETSVTDYWKELQKCRYLRTHLNEKDSEWSQYNM